MDIRKNPMTESGLAAPDLQRVIICPMFAGNAATIPAKIRRETPFPMPFSVISSPSHIRSSVPAVITLRAANVINGESGSIIPCRERSVKNANPCTNEKGTASILPYWLNLCFPASPSSLYILSRAGKTIVKSCVTIVAVMYGPSPSMTMENCSRAPPVNKLISPRS